MEEKQEKTWAMVCHLLGLVGFLGPLIIWLIKKEESAAVNENGKESLNFQLSILIYLVGAFILAAVTFGLGGILVPAIWVFDIVMIIVAAVKTNNGEKFKYPLCIRLIK